MIDAIEKKTATKRTRRMAREPKPASAARAPEAAPILGDAPNSAKRASKTDLLLGLLQRTEGATIAQIAAATGWLPHSARAALTGLKKKGHEISSDKAEGEERVYRVVTG